ncbi:MAG TPA: deoxyribose-phosphate aldolase [Candidatus Deferrimicrobium sp.]|nr:deoxyribose-phosphate aldolase [Candidatus Deferrimicrobium sp.]
MDSSKLAATIDHTLLKPQAMEADIVELCREAKEYKFASVCVNPTHVNLASKLLTGTTVKVCTVIGFPLGANTTEVKAFEAKDAMAKGASELDMVINIGALKHKNYDLVLHDIQAVVAIAKTQPGIIVKVIIETALLTQEEKIKACQLAVEAGADFVKTSTGFSGGGATKEDIALMRQTVGPQIGVKASGGVRNLQDAQAMLEAGATRIGASAGIAIVKGLEGKSDY